MATLLYQRQAWTITATATLLLLMCTCSRTFATASTVVNAPVTTANILDADAAPFGAQDLRFAVPFDLTIAQDLVVNMSQTDTPQLLVESVRTPPLPHPQSTQQESTKTCSTGLDLPPGPVQPLDRLVRADGVEISLQSLDDALAAPAGSVALLPLFTPRVSNPGSSATTATTAAASSDARRLRAFVRIEIVYPTTLEFEPTTTERKRDVAAWRALVAQREQHERELAAAAALDTQAREQEARDQLARDENARLEREAAAKHAAFEADRLGMTPHSDIHGKRSRGVEFRFAVEFVRDGPIGINWDLHTPGRTVVSDLEPALRAFALGIIAPRDQLIQLNDVNTTDFEPHEVVAVYVTLPWPRTLVFLCVSTAPPPVDVSLAITTSVTQNWTLAFLAPQVLRGWHVRLHLVNWSAVPALDTTTNHSRAMTLVQASPFLACHPLSDVATSAVAEAPDVMVVVYRGGCTFVDKATHVRQAGGYAALVLNNVKGEGRFPPGIPATGNVPLPVTMISKLDGEIVLPVMERETAVVKMFVEDAGQLPVLDVDPVPLTNTELTRARNFHIAGRRMTFWFVNTSTPLTTTSSPSRSQPSTVATLEFDVLPALFGSRIPAMPLRIVMAHPQETACHHMGLAVLATRAVVLVKRGKCSFGAKMRAVQDVGAAGMLLWNSDESLLPLMTEKKEIAGLRIWGASISSSNGSTIARILEHNRNIPSFINVAERPDDDDDARPPDNDVKRP